MKYPRLEIDLKKIKENASLIKKRCSASGIEVVGITKGFCAYPAIARACWEGGISKFGDSRLNNLKRLNNAKISGEKYLIRIPMLSEVPEVIKQADVSLNSEIEVIKALGEEAEDQNKVHRVILMVDVGDLREGVMPEKALGIVKKIICLPGIRFIGLGSNVGCFGGVLPSLKNTMLLVQLADNIKEKLNIPVEILSGGSTCTLKLLEEGKLPPEINQLRIGEAIVLGTDTTGNRKIKGLHQDTIRVVAEIIELKKKPSIPIGEIGKDAFGNVPKFKNKGIRKRAILALGRQDVPLEGLIPEDNNIEILGASSDHLILDVNDSNDNFYLGKKLAFKINYIGMLSLTTSEYIEKVCL